jgi:hypothetical protein
MVAAKTFGEWYAFFGGEDMAISHDDAVVVWNAATKAAEERFILHNKAMPKCSCGKDGFGALCKSCYESYLECCE